MSGRKGTSIGVFCLGLALLSCARARPPERTARMRRPREIYRVLAVLGGDPHDFTAVILVDGSLDLPVLMRGGEEW